MLRLITGLSAVAAIVSATLASPLVNAQSAAMMKFKQAARGVQGSPEPEQFVSKLIVKLRASDIARTQGAAIAHSLSTKAGVMLRSVSEGGDLSHVTLDAPLSLSDARAIAARLADDPMVEYAEPDVVMKPFAVPTDPEYATKQWNLLGPTVMYSGAITVPMGQPPVPNGNAVAAGAANLPTAWDRTTGASSVVVAVIDTGIVNHPDLNNAGLATLATYTPGGRFLPGYDFVSSDALGLPNNFVANDASGRDNNPADPGDALAAGDRANPLCNDNTPNQQNVAAPSTWHGTHTAGVVAATANNGAGIAGIGWDVRVVPVRALGRCGGAMSDIADAILWAAGLPVTTAPVPPVNANPARIILVGAGGKVGVACSATLQSAIDAAVQAGSVIVAAAGNEGSVTGISAPANCNNVIAVTAHSINGENASYSNVSPQVTLSAPGGGPPASLGLGAPLDNPNWDGFSIWSTTPSGAGAPVAPLTYSARIGTSAAAAQVAGVAALIKSAAPNATPVQIRGALTSSARPFDDFSSCATGRQYAGLCGVGMLDATRALQAAGPPFVVTPPASIAVAAGATASFAIEAIGAENYQWVRNGVAIAGATGPTYTTPPLAATDNNAAFVVNMSNSFGGTTSAAAVLTVTGSGSSNSPSSGGGALPMWQVLLLASLLLASRVRFSQREQ